MPLDEWLSAPYLASFTWSVPVQRVEHCDDGITYYNKSRAVDEPFVANQSEGLRPSESPTGSLAGHDTARDPATRLVEVAIPQLRCMAARMSCVSRGARSRRTSSGFNFSFQFPVSSFQLPAFSSGAASAGGGYLPQS
jgi:hypothetical protein